MALNEPKFRDSAISCDENDACSASSRRSRTSEPSGEPSTTKTTSSGASSSPASASSRSTSAGQRGLVPVDRDDDRVAGQRQSSRSAPQTTSTSSSVSSGKHGTVSTWATAWSVTGRRTSRTPRRLVVVGDGVVDVGADAGGAERVRTAGRGPRRRSPRGGRRSRRRRCRTKRPASARQRLRVPADDLPPPLVPLVETAGARRGRTAACSSSRREFQPPATSARYFSDQPYWRSARTRSSTRGVSGDDGAAVADGGEVLRGVEAERGGVAEGASPPPAATRAGGLRAVLDDGDVPAAAELDDALDVAHQPVEVRGHDCPRGVRQRRLDGLGG